MKKLLFILIVLFVSSCDYQDKGYQNSDISGCNMCLKTVEFEGCEYVYLRRYASVALTHKGNCKNEIHKK